MAQKAVELKDEGFQAIKVKLGSALEIDKLRIERIRESVGDDLTLRIDANQGWDTITAVKILQELEPLNIEFCEQPVAYWDYENLRRVTQNSPIAIMADESLFDHHDAFKLACMGCCDYFNIKLSKSGGIRLSRFRRLSQYCHACLTRCQYSLRSGGIPYVAHGAHLSSRICRKADHKVKIRDDRARPPMKSGW